MAEVITRKIPEDQVFPYTTLRLRQIASELDSIEKQHNEAKKKFEASQPPPQVQQPAAQKGGVAAAPGKQEPPKTGASSRGGPAKAPPGKK